MDVASSACAARDEDYRLNEAFCKADREAKRARRDLVAYDRETSRRLAERRFRRAHEHCVQMIVEVEDELLVKSPAKHPAVVDALRDVELARQALAELSEPEETQQLF